jgi:plastocyanin
MRRLFIVALCGLILGAPFTSAGLAARSKGKTHHVQAVGSWPLQFSWDPAELEISVGDKVMWMNSTSGEHHITPYAGPWPDDVHLHLEGEGSKSSFVFKKPGEYKYYCDLQFHGQLLPGEVCLGQCGTITVQ